MSNEADIKVWYLSGVAPSEFNSLLELEVMIDIPPEEDSPKLYAVVEDPDSFITVFGVLFTEQVIQSMAEGLADKLVEGIGLTIAAIWKKLSKTKPAKIRAQQEPEYKEPQAKLIFQLSDDESSTLDIKGDMSEEAVRLLVNSQIEIIKERYQQLNKDNK